METEEKPKRKFSEKNKAIDYKSRWMKNNHTLENPRFRATTQTDEEI